MSDIGKEIADAIVNYTNRRVEEAMAPAGSHERDSLRTERRVAHQLLVEKITTFMTEADAARYNAVEMVLQRERELTASDARIAELEANQPAPAQDK